MSGPRNADKQYFFLFQKDYFASLAYDLRMRTAEPEPTRQ